MGGIGKNRNDTFLRHQLVQYFEPFRFEFLFQIRCTREVSAGPVEVRDKPGFNRVEADRKDDRDRGGRCFCGQC